MTVLANTTRNVRLYVDGSKPESGERLVVVRWKPRKQEDGSKKPAHAARCVSIPVIDIQPIPAVLKEALTTAFYEMQDSYIREKIEAALDENADLPHITISTTEVTPDAIAVWLKATATGSGKLSKAKIEAWYDENLYDLLAAAFIEKMQISETNPEPEKLAKLEAITSNYKTAIASLASPRASIAPNVAEQMKKAISLADENDTIRKQLTAKLDTILQPREVTLMETL